ncbi:hypothetical protein BDZ91DRAFT_764705 [Kalaharituber pfeilii]|nr:hypothetical protein BDZ91DRAFT_764705 [Kalaharituber pfeilii]
MRKVPWGKVALWVLGVGLLLWCGMVIGSKWMERPEWDFKGADGQVQGGGQEQQKQQQKQQQGPDKSQMQPSHGHHHHHSTSSAPMRDILSQLPTDSVPRAVVLPDRNPQGSNHQWTLHLPSSLTYPLSPTTYRELCSSAHSAASNISALIHPGSSGHSHAGYYHEDPTFIDPAIFADPPLPEGTCDRTLTYYLASPSPNHAGMGVALMGLWLAYGLAVHENRTFFVDDTNWAWGKYSDYFAPPPEPDCLPPPKNVIVPCPHTASHILVTPLTNSETFGHEFVEEFEDGHAHDVYRQKQIFEFARWGYEDLFLLADKDEKFVAEMKQELWAVADEQYGTMKVQQGRQLAERVYQGGIVAVHVRHGNAHPMEYWYHKGYLPYETYVDVARGLIGAKDGPREVPRGDDTGGDDGWGPVILISDDPGVYDAEEMQGGWRPQSEVPLQAFFPQDVPGGRAKLKAAAAAARDLASSDIEKRRTVDERTLPGFDPAWFANLSVPERIKIGRGYLLDLKISGQMAEVRGRTGVGGRVWLLGVMMGWERGILEGRWRDVDGWVWQEPGEGGVGVSGEMRTGIGGAWRGGMGRGGEEGAGEEEDGKGGEGQGWRMVL